MEIGTQVGLKNLIQAWVGCLIKPNLSTERVEIQYVVSCFIRARKSKLYIIFVVTLIQYQLKKNYKSRQLQRFHVYACKGSNKLNIISSSFLGGETFLVFIRVAIFSLTFPTDSFGGDRVKKKGGKWFQFTDTVVVLIQFEA